MPREERGNKGHLAWLQALHKDKSSRLWKCQTWMFLGFLTDFWTTLHPDKIRQRIVQVIATGDETYRKNVTHLKQCRATQLGIKTKKWPLGVLFKMPICVFPNKNKDELIILNLKRVNGGTRLGQKDTLRRWEMVAAGLLNAHVQYVCICYLLLRFSTRPWQPEKPHRGKHELSLVYCMHINTNINILIRLISLKEPHKGINKVL